MRTNYLQPDHVGKHMTEPITNNSTEYSNLGTDEAMNLVLKAEHEAQLAVAACEREARTILEQAREIAQRIAERSDARITRIHQRCTRIVADEIKRIQQEATRRRESEHAANIDDHVIATAVEQLAFRLTVASNTSNVTVLHPKQDRSSSHKKPK